MLLDTPRMRITFVLARANLSGGVRIVAEHARMLHERGHSVTVVSIPPRTVTPWIQLRRWLRGKSLLPKLRGTHLDGLGLDWRVLDRPRPVEASDVPEADLIVATWWETAEWIAKMPDSKGVKVNFLQGFEAHPGLPAHRIDAVWRLPFRKVVVSEWLNTIARDRFGDDSAILVPNGVDTARFAFVDRSPSEQRTVGAMFSRAPFKRFPLAVRTVEAVRRRRPCRFIGFGAVPPRRHEHFADDAQFEIAPAQERIPGIYASCDCWLFTSDKEGYGLPLLEAMACGTPVVATPAGAAPELLASGGGKLVDSDDPGMLADAVEDILGLDETAWRAMSRAARAEAERHSWGVIGDRMEAALLQILAESGR